MIGSQESRHSMQAFLPAHAASSGYENSYSAAVQAPGGVDCNDNRFSRSLIAELAFLTEQGEDVIHSQSMMRTDQVTALTLTMFYSSRKGLTIAQTTEHTEMAHVHSLDCQE